MLVENEESSSRDSTVYGVAVYAVIVYMDPKTEILFHRVVLSILATYNKVVQLQSQSGF